MVNGDGLRIVLWVSGCDHYCNECHNMQTWDTNSGERFTEDDEARMISMLKPDHISGITFSGGDPMHQNNREYVLYLCDKVRMAYGNTKTIWVYTGFSWEQIIENGCMHRIAEIVDVVVDGEYDSHLRDVNYHWAGSTNQRVINSKESLLSGEVILWK